MSHHQIDFTKIATSQIIPGDEATAYRDPAAVYHDGVFHLFFTLVTNEGGKPMLHVAKSVSEDLIRWSKPKILTPSDAALNYSSPGCVVFFRGKWVMCLQTYPRPKGEKYANETARLWTMTSDDLENWNEPKLLKVKGPTVEREAMGRMIDPFFFQDLDDESKWWCSYKQAGVSMAWSHDLENWHPFGHINGGENSCVVAERGEYVLFHSPENGIGVKRSTNLTEWRDERILFLGQDGWEWAKGRITAGFVLDLQRDPRVQKNLLFFHGSGPEDENVHFDTHASIGLAWGDTLSDWSYIP